MLALMLELYMQVSKLLACEGSAYVGVRGEDRVGKAVNTYLLIGFDI